MVRKATYDENGNAIGFYAVIDVWNLKSDV